MTVLHAFLLGIVEGITEFLPISSTAHLLMTQHLLGIGMEQRTASFDIIIQLGAILAACFFFQKTILHNRRKMMIACIGFLPTGIIGLMLHSIVKTFFFESMTLIGSSLLFGGIAIVLCEYIVKRKESSIQAVSIVHALIIGTIQSLALLPGVSRSAATIMTGLLLGITRKEIVEFSFLLAIPTMLAATGLDIVKHIDQFSQNDVWLIAIGFVMSFITAYCAIRWLLTFITQHTFMPFAIYRIVLGGLILTLTLS